MQQEKPSQQQLRLMNQGPEQQDHVAAREIRGVSIREDVDVGLVNNNTVTMSIDSSSPSPSKDSDPVNTSLALPLAGPVDEDPDDEEDDNDDELRKIEQQAARAVMANNEAITTAIAIDMDGDGTDIKIRTKGWKLCTVLTTAALVIIAAAVVVTVVYGQRGGKPSASHQDDSEDASSP